MKEVKKKGEKVEAKKAIKKKRGKKVGYFGISPIRRYAHDLGYKRISNEALRLISGELENYCRKILNACAQGALEHGRTTITKKDFDFAFRYIIKRKPVLSNTNRD